MGAGSAKGVQREDNGDDVDSFSSGSSDQWEEEDPTPAPAEPVKPVANPKPAPKPQKPLVENQPKPGTSTVVIEKVETEMKKKKRFGFGFRNEKKDEGKDSSDEEGKKGNERGSDKDGKKEKKGFRLFGWKKDEKDEKETEALDEDISELEKTFDSLGIDGNKMWSKLEGIDDVDGGNEGRREDAVLSPMRKRKNIRGRVKGINGTNGRGSSASNASKRTFKFSWESDKTKSPTKDEEDEWEYKAVVIEGFDIEKFRKANLKDNVFDSNSLPNVVGVDEDAGSNKVSSPLRYDQTEQYILASIERDFAT